jgi:3'(2'), 5'-bisphosphate nucleotidase
MIRTLVSCQIHRTLCSLTLVVDGTSGFIRKQQYAVCLALIIDGQVELGVIGCPNLGSQPAKMGEEIIPNGEGVLMIAVRGEGSYSVRSY